MPSKKPEKRWVHKGEFLGLVKLRFRHVAIGFLGILGGILYLLLRLGWEQLTSPPEPPAAPQGPHHLSPLAIIGLILLALLALFVEFHEIFFFVYRRFKAATEV